MENGDWMTTEASNLLHVLKLDRIKRMPLMAEFEVPDTAPFLVTSTRSLYWVPRSKSGRVRAAVRPAEDWGVFFLSVVNTISEQATAAGWGNVQPFTAEGIQAAIDHLSYYELTDLDILSNPQTDWKKIDPDLDPGKDGVPVLVRDCPVISTPWLPPGVVVVVPSDRAFLGFMIQINDGPEIMSVIHNASRGIGIARM